jgi:hypothetical protein
VIVDRRGPLEAIAERVSGDAVEARVAGIEGIAVGAGIADPGGSIGERSPRLRLTIAPAIAPAIAIAPSTAAADGEHRSARECSREQRKEEGRRTDAHAEAHRSNARRAGRNGVVPST